MVFTSTSGGPTSAAIWSMRLLAVAGSWVASPDSDGCRHTVPVLLFVVAVDPDHRVPGGCQCLREPRGVALRPRRSLVATRSLLVVTSWPDKLFVRPPHLDSTKP